MQRDASAKDESLLQAIEQYDEYLADQQHAAELLKQGFLKLTMAKMNLPAHAVGELSYKDHFESALYVIEDSEGMLRTIKADEREHIRDAERTDNAPASALKRRRDRGGEEEPSASKASERSSADAEDAAIMWFSSLPPQNLRLAQKNFRSALQALLASAASTRKIHNAVHEACAKSLSR